MFQNITQEFLSEHFILIFFFYINVCSFLDLACSSWTSSSDRHEWLYSLASSKNDLRQNISFSSAFLMTSESGMALAKEGSGMRSLVVPSHSDLNLYLSDTLWGIRRSWQLLQYFPHSPTHHVTTTLFSPSFGRLFIIIHSFIDEHLLSTCYVPHTDLSDGNPNLGDLILKDKVCWSLNPSGALEHLGIKSLTPHSGCHRTAKYKGNEYFH